MSIKSIWLYKSEPSEGIDLTLRIEHKESAPEMTCEIELDRPGIKNAVFRITKDAVQRIEAGLDRSRKFRCPNRAKLVRQFNTDTKTKNPGLLSCEKFPRSQMFPNYNFNTKLGMGRA
jgi:hypothetical protein